MCCLSLVIKHETVCRNINGSTRYYVCFSSRYPNPPKTARKWAKEGAAAPDQLVEGFVPDQPETMGLCTHERGECPFHLHYHKRAGDGKWRLVQVDSLNTVSRTCSEHAWAHICGNTQFLLFYAKNWLGKNNLTVNRSNLESCWERIFAEGLDPLHRRSVLRANNELLGMSVASTLVSDQQLEDYIRNLNKANQYGVLLYSNGIMVVPDVFNPGEPLRFRLCPDSVLHFPDDPSLRYYWESCDVVEQDPVELHDDQSSKLFVSMTFEAVSAAVGAFQYSLPVICLDACTTYCVNRKTVLLSACFGTTNNRILPMCFGTASGESNEAWFFFLKNLRQVLKIFCANYSDWSSIVFMSDRHTGIINGIYTLFPEAKHVYCAEHIWRNLNCKGTKRVSFFDVVDAVSEQDYKNSLDQFLKSVDTPEPGRKTNRPRNANEGGPHAPTNAHGREQVPSSAASNGSKTAKSRRVLKILSAVAIKHWVRFAVKNAGIRRYSVRTNNWAESLNNALKEVREGPVLHVLHKAFLYASKKLRRCQKDAEKMRADRRSTITTHAADKLKTNKLIAMKTVIVDSSENEWTVQELSKTYTVTRSGDMLFSCTCLRYFDEGIPCQHILKVAESLKLASSEAMVSRLFSKDVFIRTFLNCQAYYPPGIESYSRNLNVDVIIESFGPGRRRVVRYLSVGEPPNHGHTSKAPYRPVPPFAEGSMLSEGTSSVNSVNAASTESIAAQAQVAPHSSGQDVEVLSSQPNHHPAESILDSSALRQIWKEPISQQLHQHLPSGRRPLEQLQNVLQRRASQQEESAIPPLSLPSPQQAEKQRQQQVLWLKRQIEQYQLQLQQLEQPEQPEQIEQPEQQEQQLLPPNQEHRQELLLPLNTPSDTDSLCSAAVDHNSLSTAVEDGEEEMNSATRQRDDTEERQDRLPDTTMTGSASPGADDTTQSFAIPNYHIVIAGPNSLRLKSMLMAEKRAREQDGCCMQPPKKQQKVKSDQKKYAVLLKHDEFTYLQWELLYRSEYCLEFDAASLEPNKKPSRRYPALVPLVCKVPLRDIPDWNKAATRTIDVTEKVGRGQIEIAEDLVSKFLARVHAFTAVGLQAEAFAYSFGDEGTIKYLVLLPQEATPCSVESKPLKSRKHEPDDLTVADVQQRLQRFGPAEREGCFIQSCWLLTHPRSTVFLTEKEIYKLYLRTKAATNKQMFAIVLSPRNEGLKAICLRLTKTGFNSIDKAVKRAQKQRKDPEKEVLECMPSFPPGLLCQIPFTVACITCDVLDLRGDEVIAQLKRFIDDRSADKNWA